VAREHLLVRIYLKRYRKASYICTFTILDILKLLKVSFRGRGER
jgi:hypothetical protein